LTELVYTQIANTSRDLEVFAKHAGRKAINADDVMLLTRRNDALETMLRKELEDMKAADGRVEVKKVGDKGKGKGKGKGKAKA
jgi:centromere protein S